MIHILYLLVNLSKCRSLECSYNIETFFLVLGYKYNCKVNNDLYILSSNSTQVDSVKGIHPTGHSNDDEIYFYARDKTINYFPSGLEKFFPNLKGIVISHSGLKEVHQSDLQPHSKLTYLSLPYNEIQIIDDDLFDSNLDMEMIFLQENQIFFIGSTTFDNLPGLVTLNLKENTCINKETKYNREAVMDIIKNVKNQCDNQEISRLERMLETIENISKNLKIETYINFKEKLENFEIILEMSNFSNYQPLMKRLLSVSDWKLQIFLTRNRIEMLEKSTNEIIKVQNDTMNDKLSNLEIRLSDKIDIKIETLENVLVALMTKFLENSTTDSNKIQTQTLNDKKIDNLEKLLLAKISESLDNNLTESVTKLLEKSTKELTKIQNETLSDKMITIENSLSAKIDEKIEKLQNILANSITNALKDIEINLRTIQSNMKDEFEVTNYRVVESSQINGIWKSTLIACCTFLASLILFIAYQKFLFRSMTWDEDEMVYLRH